MNEREFQTWVIQTAKALGWVVWHVPMPMQPIPGGKFVPSKRGRGLLDLIMFHEDPALLVFVENKARDGKLSDEQREFIRLLRLVIETIRVSLVPGVRVPLAVYSWRPGHEAVIETVLRSKVVG